jgi:hypothetical protein
MGAMIPAMLYITANKFTTASSGIRRTIENGFLQLTQSAPRSNDIYRVIGTHENKIYFASTHYGVLYEGLNSITNLKKDSFVGLSQSNYVLYTPLYDYPLVMFCIGNRKKIYTGDLRSQKIVDSAVVPLTFTRVSHVCSNIFDFRAFEKEMPPNQIFIKVNLTNSSFQKEEHISERNNDAGISTDGLLNYDSNTSTLVYSYFYKSEVLLLDTNLHKIVQFHTIDSLNTTETRSGAVDTTKKYLKYTNLTPRYIHNAYSYVSNGKLYINSSLKADNEPSNIFDNNSVIDVYDINKRKYLYSFYVPYYDGEKMRDFAVFSGVLVALYKKYIATYKMPLQL